jgi:hypothetical protein
MRSEFSTICPRMIWYLKSTGKQPKANPISHFFLNWATGGTAVTVHECNHNVAVLVIQNPQPESSNIIHASFLHPYDVSLSKAIRINSSDFDGKQQAGFENFMTSKQLDDHCVNGKYYMAWHTR